MIHRAARRLDLVPDREVEHAVEWRNVEARDCLGAFLHLFALAQIFQQILGRRLVAAERPDAPEIRIVGDEPPFRPAWRGERPAVLRHLRLVALRHRPGGGRIEDQRALPRDQRAVVRRAVEAQHFARQELHQLLAIFQHLPHLVRSHGDIALGIDQIGAVRGKQRAAEIDAVAGIRQPECERHAGLLTGLGGLQMCIPCPGIGARRVSPFTGYID